MAPSFDHPSFISRATITTTTKRRKLINNHHQNNHQPLLPGLPDHIAQLCLNLVPPTTLYSVCRSWRRLIYTHSFPPFLSLYTLSSTTHNPTIKLSSFDPISSKWTTINPSTPYLRHVRLHHPSFIARDLPMQSLSVAGNLIFLAGTSSDLFPALPRPIIFNPVSKTWSCGPQLSTPRRWCAAGSSRAAVVVASGIGSNFTQSVARSVDKWVLNETNLFDGKVKDGSGVWIKMKALKDVKFSREAVEAVGCKGRLYMVNGRGAWGKEGVIYDVGSDEWWQMPEEMAVGWRGPAAAMEEEVIFMVDEKKGVLRKYDEGVGVWVDVVEDERLKGAERVAAGGGRVCVVGGGGGGGGGVVVVDVVAVPPRVVVLDTPVGEHVVGLHILPRMCPPEFESNSF